MAAIHTLRPAIPGPPSACRRVAPPSVALLCALGAAALSRAEAVDRIARVVPIAPATTISVHVTVGDVAVHGWDRADVSVAIVRRAGDAAALERIPARIDESGGALAVRAEQVDNGRDPALRADVELRVPAGATIGEIAVFEGRIALADLRGTYAARAERGDIAGTRLGGVMRLETAIGDIRLERIALAAEGLVRLRTFNGDVTLTLAEPPRHARILALSLGGRVRSDIPLTTRDRWGPRFGEATLGDGEPLVSIDVVNGDIAIRLEP